MIVLAGVEDSLWYLDLKNGNGSVGKGKPDGKPDCKISMDYKSLLDMLSGKRFFLLVKYLEYILLFHQ